MVKRHLLGVVIATLIVASGVSASTEANILVGPSGSISPEVPLQLNISELGSLTMNGLFDDDLFGDELSRSFLIEGQADPQDAVIAIPEPGAVSLIALAGILSLTRRRRMKKV